MKSEFAHVDYLVNEAVNIRAGILLMPIGKFNLLHDSPLNDLSIVRLSASLSFPAPVRNRRGHLRQPSILAAQASWTMNCM